MPVVYLKKKLTPTRLPTDHIEQIMQVFDSKANAEHLAQSIPFETIAAKDYNLSVSSYVEAKDNREVVDITQLNAELTTAVDNVNKLRAEIDVIVAKIEG